MNVFTQHFVIIYKGTESSSFFTVKTGDEMDYSLQEGDGERYEIVLFALILKRGRLCGEMYDY